MGVRPIGVIAGVFGAPIVVAFLLAARAQTPSPSVTETSGPPVTSLPAPAPKAATLAPGALPAAIPPTTALGPGAAAPAAEGPPATPPTTTPGPGAAAPAAEGPPATSPPATASGPGAAAPTAGAPPATPPTTTPGPAAAAPAAEALPATTPGPGAETPAEASPAAPPSTIAPVLGAEQLDQLLAPIALYPDALLAQILMAATYPLEIVKANRWFRDPRHAALSGDQLAAALESETWDPSVKALVNVPQILMMMDTNLDWTEELGDAFVAQQADVMDAIQRLRHQAAAAGTLWSNTQQNVTEEGQGIAIEPANPGYIYPPLYNPALVYGPWPSPEFPPLDIVPPDYGVGFGLPFGLSFGAGFVIVNKIWPWCVFDWGQRRIRRSVQTSKPVDHTAPGSESAIWRHDPARRAGVASFDLGSRARLAMFRNHFVSVAAMPQIAAPRVAGLPMISSHPATRAFAPARMGPALTPARVAAAFAPARMGAAFTPPRVAPSFASARMGPVGLAPPGHRIAGRPMMMTPQMAARQPAAWPMPRAVAPLRAPPPAGGPHSDGASHR